MRPNTAPVLCSAHGLSLTTGAWYAGTQTEETSHTPTTPRGTSSSAKVFPRPCIWTGSRLSSARPRLGATTPACGATCHAVLSPGTTQAPFVQPAGTSVPAAQQPDSAASIAGPLSALPPQAGPSIPWTARRPQLRAAARRSQCMPACLTAAEQHSLSRLPQAVTRQAGGLPEHGTLMQQLEAALSRRSLTPQLAQAQLAGSKLASPAQRAPALRAGTRQRVA
ncbi:hypothetical protein V8C86DRAFT_2558444 [Haematococcus lacustris]